MDAPKNAPRPDYVGDEICFYEEPYGCEIVTQEGMTIVIRSPKDAKALADSLLVMWKTLDSHE